MRAARTLQTEVERLVLTTADGAEALRKIAGLLCERTGSPVALLARWEDEERCATLLAHPGLSARLAHELCVALVPCAAACLRSGKPLAPAPHDKVVLAALPDELRANKIGRLL